MMIAANFQRHGHNGRRVSAKGTRRAAYTLLELAAVAALILFITALTIPAISSTLADARVDGSGDMIRARMADARSMAMEQSKPFRFGFLPGTGKFQIAADDSDVWNTVQDGPPIDDKDHVRGELLPDVVFATDPGSLSSSGAGASGNGWQLGGVFLPTGEARGPLNPDGTSVNDVTFYFGRTGSAPRGVRLRGLTGIVRVFDPSADEGDQP